MGHGTQQRCHLLLTGPETAKTALAAERQVAAVPVTPEKGIEWREILFFPLQGGGQATALGLAGWLPLTQCWSKGKTELTFQKGQSELQLAAMPRSCKEGEAHHVADPQQKRETGKERSVWLPCDTEFKKERLLGPTKREIFYIFSEYFFMTGLTL